MERLAITAGLSHACHCDAWNAKQPQPMPSTVTAADTELLTPQAHTSVAASCAQHRANHRPTHHNTAQATTHTAVRPPQGTARAAAPPHPCCPIAAAAAWPPPTAAPLGAAAAATTAQCPLLRLQANRAPAPIGGQQSNSRMQGQWHPVGTCLGINAMGCGIAFSQAGHTKLVPQPGMPRPL